MSVRLPLIPTTPIYRVGTSLSGVQFLLDVRWNSRDEAWYLTISTEADEIIRAGMRIVLGTLLGGRVVSDEFPPGVFIAADLSNRGEEATLSDLGTRVVVDYYGFEEDF